MRVPTWLLAGLGLWFVGECLAFGLVVHWLGATGAILIGIATSIGGAALMRRVGVSAVRTLRQTMANGRLENLPPGAMLDGTLAGLGALLLLLPGFLSDAVGLALASPAVRQALVRLRTGRGVEVPRGHRDAAPPVIDLGAGEWRRLDERS